jgi:hypothetical protein
MPRISFTPLLFKSRERAYDSTLGMAYDLAVGKVYATLGGVSTVRR